MASKVRIKLNREGVRQLLNGPEITADLQGRASAIANRAGPGFDPDVRSGRNRARATVRTATHSARVAEATDRSLTRAIDAGR